MAGDVFDADAMSLFTDDGERKYLNSVERKRFYKSRKIITDKSERIFVELIFWTGCRISEAVQLNPIKRRQPQSTRLTEMHLPHEDERTAMTCPVPTHYPALHLNWEDWSAYLEASDATDAEKRALIEALWSIVVAFVDLGWDVSSDKKICGEELDLSEILNAAVLNSNITKEQEKEEV